MPDHHRRLLASLPDTARLYLHCDRCGRQSIVPVPRMIEKAGAHATIAEVQARVMCGRCRKRGQQVTLQVWID